MPVRKIRKNHCTVTGLVATNKSDRMTAYEGPLERDFMRIATFDHNVLKYEEQPVKIIYIDADGKQHSYTPDILVFYRTDIEPAKWMKPMLAEIKPRYWVKEKWKELKPKFRAAIRHAKEKGWNFKILTDREIRTPYLKNASFLLHFRDRRANEAAEAILIEKLKELDEATPETLLLAITEDRNRQAQLLPSLWRLIANRVINADLEEPLTMCSSIWFPSKQ